MEGDFLELNDLAGNHVKEIAIKANNDQQQGMQVDLNILAEEENLFQLANQDMWHIQVVNVNVWPEEIHPDELLGKEDEFLAEGESRSCC